MTDVGWQKTTRETVGSLTEGQPFARMTEALESDEPLVFLSHMRGVCAVEATLASLSHRMIGTLKTDQPLLFFSSLSTEALRSAAADLILDAPSECGIGLQPGDGELLNVLLSGKGLNLQPQGQLTVTISEDDEVSVDMFVFQRSEVPPKSVIKPMGKKLPELEGNLDRRADWFKKGRGNK